MITITDKAIAKIKEISEAEGIGHTTVRIKVLGGGCSGFTYDMEYEDKVGDLDEIMEQDGVKVVVDSVSVQYLENVSIDYTDGLMGGGFSFKNPEQTGGCGCGKSFSM